MTIVCGSCVGGLANLKRRHCEPRLNRRLMCGRPGRARMERSDRVSEPRGDEPNRITKDLRCQGDRCTLHRGTGKNDFNTKSQSIVANTKVDCGTTITVNG